MNFKLEILTNFEFWGYQICQQTVHEITKFYSHFQLKSKWEDKTSYFLARNKVKISKRSSKNKNNLIIVGFDGSYYQIFVT